MYSKIVRVSYLPKPTASSFVRPVCRTAHYFCQLARKDSLSITDLLIIQDIGFYVKIFAE